MTNTFDLFASDADTEESGDVLPSAGFGPLDTGLYKMGITLAYLSESKNGAHGLNLHLKNADGSGPVVRQTLWMTSGKAKGQRNSYVDDNGVKHKLPGMEQADNLHALLTGVMLIDADSEEKTVKLWNPATSKEENTPVTVIKGLMNQPVLIGLHKNRDNKMILDKATSKYVADPSGKDRVYNEINKFFDADTGLTYAEKKAKTTDPAYLAKWKETFDSTYVRDRYKEVNAEIAADFAAAGGGGQTKALFP
jgi:hypothetical protein